MKPPEKISLLIMRDSGETRRFRLRRSWLRTMCILCCLMPLLAVGSLWFAVDTWFMYRDLHTRHSHLEQNFHRVQAQATRLSHLEVLLQRRDTAETAILARNLSLAPHANPIPVQDPPLGPEGESGPGHLEFPVINTGFVTLENTQVRVIPGNKLRISMDLVNGNPPRTISGKVSCVLTTAGGDILPLEVMPSSARDFRITRLKRMVLVLPLPSETNPDNAQVILEIRNDKAEMVYRNIFPVAR